MIEVVVGILKQDNKVLVGQRAEGMPYSGYWEFPGGKIEKDELPFDALKRELTEELGIVVTQAELLFTHSHQYPDKTVSLNIWRVDKFTGQVQAKEHCELRWVTFAEMLELNLLEGNYSIIEKIKQGYLS